jgi:hypothetical protein
MPEVFPFVRQIDSNIVEEAHIYYHNQPENMKVSERVEKITTVTEEDRFWNYTETKRLHVTLISTYSPEYLLIDLVEVDKETIEKVVQTNTNCFCTVLEDTPKYRTLPTNILSRTVCYFRLTVELVCYLISSHFIEI